MKLLQKLSQVKPAFVRHVASSNVEPYEQILKYVRTYDDVWIAAQGEYMAWWQQRENASLAITVFDGRCRVQTSLEHAVLEKFPGEFLKTYEVDCPETAFAGEVWITIDSALEHKEILIEILKREGILNYKIAERGPFMLCRQDVGELLAEIKDRVRERQGRLLEADVSTIRQVVLDKLAVQRLPLIRVWYHPRRNGRVIRMVFSARYDVDRAITNLGQIRALEQKYDAPSTLYMRSFCPFYSDQDVAYLAAQPWCSEIALHGEFVTNGRNHYGDEIKAAAAEKIHLEKVTDRPVLGVGMHGGELSGNVSPQTEQAMEQAGFLYDTTPRPRRYYFPYRPAVNGHLSTTYSFPHALSDVNISPGRRYGREFYEQARAKFDEIYEQNGIFVLMLHPVYFGFWAYLAKPRNWLPLLKFMMNYVKSSHI